MMGQSVGEVLGCRKGYCCSIYLSGFLVISPLIIPIVKLYNILNLCLGLIPAQCEYLPTMPNYCTYTTYLPAFDTNFARALSLKLGLILMSICIYVSFCSL